MQLQKIGAFKVAQETLGERLRFYRRKAALNQGQLAKKIGVSTSLVSQWEREIIQPSYNHLDQMANVFMISQEELVPSPRSQTTDTQVALLQSILTKLQEIDHRLETIETMLDNSIQHSSIEDNIDILSLEAQLERVIPSKDISAHEFLFNILDTSDIDFQNAIIGAIRMYIDRLQGKNAGRQRLSYKELLNKIRTLQRAYTRHRIAIPTIAKEIYNTLLELAPPPYAYQPEINEEEIASAKQLSVETPESEPIVRERR